MKFCNRCKLAIDTDKERYVTIEDKDGKKSLSKLYFHKNCWKDMMVIKNEAKQGLSKAQKILNFAARKMGFEEEVKV